MLQVDVQQRRSRFGIFNSHNWVQPGNQLVGKNYNFVANSFKRHAFSRFSLHIDSALMNHLVLIEFVKNKAAVFKVDLFSNVLTKYTAKYLASFSISERYKKIFYVMKFKNISFLEVEKYFISDC